jgi:hypothetical protein
VGAVANGLGSGLTTTAKIRFFRRRNAIAIGPRQPDVALYQLLREAIVRKDAVQLGARWDDMYETSRNLGRGGITSMAVSAVDVALWDLKAKMLGVPVYVLLGAVRSRAPVYGSGGFTAYSEQQLCQQLAGWVNDGIPRPLLVLASPQRVHRDDGGARAFPWLRVGGGGHGTASPSISFSGLRLHPEGQLPHGERRSHRKDAVDQFARRPGVFDSAQRPLDLVQIDHTKLDIIVVDDEQRLPIGRPWITLAIDVYSRMVARLLRLARSARSDRDGPGATF